MPHVGYAGRSYPKFRYEGDPREISLALSKEAVQTIHRALTEYSEKFEMGLDPEAHGYNEREVITEVNKALSDIINDNLIGL